MERAKIFYLYGDLIGNRILIKLQEPQKLQQKLIQKQMKNNTQRKINVSRTKTKSY